MSITIYNRYNAPKGKKANPGAEIYEYEYLDKKTGKLEKVSKNIQEKIQSCFGLTDYKTRIANGEEVLNGITGEIIQDYRAIPTDKVSLIDFLNMASNMDEEQIANFIQQASQGNQETTQAGQEVQETTQGTTQEQADASEPVPSSSEQGGV